MPKDLGYSLRPLRGQLSLRTDTRSGEPLLVTDYEHEDEDEDETYLPIPRRRVKPWAILRSNRGISVPAKAMNVGALPNVYGWRPQLCPGSWHAAP